MADSLCGPSNALQSFQKHSTVDRALQQDRLVARQSPSQGFRSSPGPNAGLLDSEFEAFQAGNLPLESRPGFQPQFSHPSTPFKQQQYYQPPTPQSLHQPGPSNWANDFQRSNISSPTRPSQFNAPAQRQDTGGWHQDFAQQYGGGEQRGMMPNQMGGQYGSQYSAMGGMSMGMQPQFGGGLVQQAQPQQQQAPETFDDEAFARAFEEAARLEMDTEERQQERSQGMEMGQDILLSESAERLMSDVTTEQPLTPDQQRIGADLIHDPSKGPEPAPEDPDALARTAAQLLNAVRGNQSEKFANSQFLSLMRQFRDKEAMVEGDKIVDSAGDSMGAEQVQREEQVQA